MKPLDPNEEGEMEEEPIQQDFFKKLAKEFLGGAEPWEVSFEYKLGVESFASFLDRTRGVKKDKLPVVEME